MSCLDGILGGNSIVAGNTGVQGVDALGNAIVNIHLPCLTPNSALRALHLDLLWMFAVWVAHAELEAVRIGASPFMRWTVGEFSKLLMGIYCLYSI